MARIHILGASGSGTTTLGAALARHLGIAHVDTDSLYWMPTDPPFTTPRPLPERQALLIDRLPDDADWILSGSALKWGEPVEPLYDLVVFLTLDPKVRMARILKREQERYGARIAPGGDMFAISQAFIAWAAAYDTAGPEQRSRRAHEAWLAADRWPILRLDSAEPVEALVTAVSRHLDQTT